VENLYSDHLILVVQLYSDVWVEFNASGFWLFGNDQMKHVLLFELLDTFKDKSPGSQSKPDNSSINHPPHRFTLQRVVRPLI
jgi:hypothetical protein